MSSFANDYVGIPFKDKGRDRKGVDCWGLCRLIYAERFGLQVPDLGEQYGGIDDVEDIQRIFRTETARDWVQVKEPKAGDLIVMEMKGRPIHFGIVVDGTFFVHTKEGAGTVCSRYRSVFVRLIGFYRHKEMMLDV